MLKLGGLWYLVRIALASVGLIRAFGGFLDVAKILKCPVTNIDMSIS
jgi:hypothetical protein